MIRQLRSHWTRTFRDQRAVPMLANKLKDAHMGVRRNTAYALAMPKAQIPYYLVSNIRPILRSPNSDPSRSSEVFL